jgi:hypothetical protein
MCRANGLLSLKSQRYEPSGAISNRTARTHRALMRKGPMTSLLNLALCRSNPTRALTRVTKESSPMANIPESHNLSSLLHALASAQANAKNNSIATLAQRDRSLGHLLGSLDPFQAIATFGGLLTRPELRSNCVRLEALVHLAAFQACGAKRPNRDVVSRAFQALGPSLGLMEDPAEAQFVSLIPTDRGNFRIFEGIFEGAAFHLCRFIEAVEEMPRTPPFGSMQNSIFALLALSEAVADRKGVDVRTASAPVPLRHLPSTALGSLAVDRKLVTFTQDELRSAGISRDALRPFAFTPAMRDDLGESIIGHTPLERRPVILTENGAILALPTAVSCSIRRYLIERCSALGQEHTLAQALTANYGKLLREMPILGGPMGAPLTFRNVDGIQLATTMIEIDDGRWLHLLAFMDDFHNYEIGGLVGTNTDSNRLGEKLSSKIAEAAAKATSSPGYRGGMTLVVGCGWGRGLGVSGMEMPEGWRNEVISAHDLETLSDLPDYRPTTLWRTLDMREEIEKLGLHLENINGLLNLVAWQRRLDEHLVPHSQLPNDFASPGSPAFLVIEQNALREVREQVAVAVDRRRLQDVRGRWISMRRTGSSVFREDQVKPSYAADDEARRGRLKGAFVTSVRTWWVNVDGVGSRQLLFKHWEMMHHWIGEAAPVIEALVPHLPSGPIEWDLHFDGLDDSRSAVPDPFDWSGAHQHFDIEVLPNEGIVRMRVDGEFQAAFHHPENLAERAIVMALLAATGSLVRQEFDSEVLLVAVDTVVRNPQARHMHMIEAREFRDFVSASLPREYVRIAEGDGAMLSLGLGWKTRARNDAPEMRGKAECTAFLNATVSKLEEELCIRLSQYERRNMLSTISSNYEATAKDKNWWSRTASAVLGLRRDRDDVLEVMAKHEAPRNGVFQASRILLEATMCECPEKEGANIGDIDLSRLMALSNCIVNLGGWSNAIRWDGMEPRLKISPLGNILAESNFENQVMAPFGRMSNDVLVGHAVARYPRRYEPEEFNADIEPQLDEAFASAWRAEMGCSIDQSRTAIHAIESEGIRQNAAVFEIKASQLLKILSENGMTAADSQRFLNGLTMTPRPSWRQAPDGYRAREREPWRYRRQLSVLRLPLLQMDAVSDPTLLLVPGMVREAFLYLARGFHEGDFDQSYAMSTEMRSWIGAATNKRGHAFNSLVNDRMLELGWNAHSDVRITRLLGKGFSRNFGDVDVLAWNDATGRVLLMECKDLNFRKTHGEIAEQLSDFRGGTNDDGKPDLLKKHLDRYELVRKYGEELRRFTKLKIEPTVECHVIFRNPVAMQFAWSRLEHMVHLSLFDGLAAI